MFRKLLTPVLKVVNAFLSMIWTLIDSLFPDRPLRFLFIQGRHIGHLTVDTDCYLKAELLGKHPAYTTVAVVWDISNPHLLKYFRKRLYFIRNRFIAAVLWQFRRFDVLQYDARSYAQIEGETSLAPVIYREWGSRTPLWELDEEDSIKGRQVLDELGIPNGAWFVCVHCREGGYDSYWDIQNYRNCNIDNYFKGMSSLVERGAWLVRMGDVTMSPLPRMNHVVDYCHSRFKSDWMDVFLCASCRFFLGSGSGIAWLASIFGVPVASANQAPMSATLYLRPGDINIPRLNWSLSDDRYLSFDEILNSPLGNFRRTHQFEESGIRLMENTPDDIRDLAIEMLDTVEGKALYTAEDEMLQQRFASLLGPGHFTFGSGARIGRDFLRKYSHLLRSSG